MALKDIKKGDDLKGIKCGDREVVKEIVTDSDGNEHVVVLISEAMIVTELTTPADIAAAKSYHEKEAVNVAAKVAKYNKDLEDSDLVATPAKALAK